MAGVARFGDLIAHLIDGHWSVTGAIITGSISHRGDSLGVARVGDLVWCSKHGDPFNLPRILTGSPDVLNDNLPTARLGDWTSCGAMIITASSDVSVNT